MQPLIKKVVKRPDKNKFVLRTAAPEASFLQAACRVRPARCGPQGAVGKIGPHGQGKKAGAVIDPN